MHIWAVSAVHTLHARPPGCCGRPQDPGVCQLPPDNGINVSHSQISRTLCAASRQIDRISRAQSATNALVIRQRRRTQQTRCAPQPRPLERPGKSMGNAFTVHDICFSVRRFGNITAPRSFSRGFHLEPFTIDAHRLFLGAVRDSEPASAPTAALTPTS